LSRGAETRADRYGSGLTGVTVALLSAVAWLLVYVYWNSHEPPTEPLPSWVMLLDRLIAPVGTIGVALLVLAWLERHVALLLFTLGYLALVLVPIDTFRIPPSLWGYPTELLLPQVIGGVALLLGTVGFAAAHGRQR
jgi:hypothetical protein